MKCRHCNSDLLISFADLGSAPPSNAYLDKQDLLRSEKWFPLEVKACTQCWLVQTVDYSSAEELFTAHYAYFSAFSKSWLKHCQRYVHDMVTRFSLNKDSHVVEVAANDGYLLQYVKELNIPCIGIEPTSSTANAARQKGLNIIEEFFGTELAVRMAKDGKKADLVIANNVLAHVPDINDFVSGFNILLSSNGVATFEFPSLLNLVEKNQFDTIYHEHFSYLSFTAVHSIFKQNGLTVFDVEEHPTHGGSLRVFAMRAATGSNLISASVGDMLAKEMHAGITKVAFYENFQSTLDKIKDQFLQFLLQAKDANKTVVAYGAAAKGNTLMNYAGIRKDLIKFIIDRNPAKQKKFMPGSRIPIFGEEKLIVEKPDFIVILPWNLSEELNRQLSYVKDWGGKLLTAVPELKMLN